MQKLVHLLCKFMDWFLNERNLRYERVQVSFCHSLSSSNLPLNFTYYSPAKMLVKGKEDLIYYMFCFVFEMFFSLKTMLR